jgi:hypothetical protein
LALELLTHYLHPPEYCDWWERGDYPTTNAYLQATDLARLRTLIFAQRLGSHSLDAAVANDIVDDHIDDDLWYSSMIFRVRKSPGGAPRSEAHVRGSETGLLGSVSGEEALEQKLPRAFLLDVLRRHRELRQDHYSRDFWRRRSWIIIRMMMKRGYWRLGGSGSWSY